MKVGETGKKAENFFSELLDKGEIQHTFVDDWFDFLIKGKYKVEIKSCQISIKKDNRFGYCIGRFDFTNGENLKKSIEENIWIGFIIRHQNQFIIYGFLRAEKIKDRKRYINIHQLRQLKPMSFEDWLLELHR